MKKTLYILTLLLFVSNSYSQKEYHNWIFGHGCYITFDTDDGNPVFVDSIPYTILENSSVISTSDGDLLLYSGGSFIYNSNNEIISSQVHGDYSTMQGGCIFQVDEDHYIRVGSNYSGVSDPAFPTLSYVDIVKTGSGYSVSKNKILDRNFRYEGLLVLKSYYDNVVYLIVPNENSGSTALNLYKYENNSFNLVQSLKLDHDLPYHHLKYSPVNGLISAKNHENGGMHFFRFDAKDGMIRKLSKNSKVDIPERILSMEFSPNGNYLYILTRAKAQLFRLEGLNRIEESNLTLTHFNDIDNASKNDYNFQLQLGPNNKIYMSANKRNYLSVIDKPDNKFEINFIHEAIDLKNCYSLLGLPNIPVSFYNQIVLEDSIFVCEGDSLKLNAELNIDLGNIKYSWTGPRYFTSEQLNPEIYNIQLNQSGYYKLQVLDENNLVIMENKIFVKVIENPSSELFVYPKKITCVNESVEVELLNKFTNYKWTTGENTSKITVKEPGVYGVTYTNEYGCSGYTEVEVKSEKMNNVEILGPKEICHGSEEIYSANRDYETYLWSNGDDTKTTLISEAGTYWLEVTTAEGCTISDTIDISYHPNLIAELKPAPTTICEGDSVLLESRYEAPYMEYQWSTGGRTSKIYVDKSGTYKLSITDTRTGCMDSTEIAISVEDNLQPTIVGTDICEGETATLAATPNDPSYSYEWSNGESTPTIVVSQPATYTVTVSKDGCSGTAEFTVNESPNPEFEILGEDIICANSAILSCSEDYAEYLWSTDEVTKEIEVTEPGTYTLTVTDENGCSATEEFTVNEQSLSFDISKDRIDFGKVYISETTIDSATIINRSGIELTITDGTQNYTIPDGFPVQYTKTLEPTELGPYTDSFEYRVIEPCDTVITIPVTAEVYARVEISTKEETETEIGAEVSIPVYLQAKADLSEQTYTISTDIDKTVLFTEDDFTITQTASINKAKTQIHEINGMIMLASELEYDITFPSYEFNNPYIEVSTKQGTIKIDSVCAFPQRSIIFTETTELKVSPNPARDRLVVDISTDVSATLNVPEMTLELISSEGRVAYTENWTQSSSEKQISINTDKIPSGLYQVRLQTPSGVLTENVIVVM